MVNALAVMNGRLRACRVERGLCFVGEAETAKRQVFWRIGLYRTKTCRTYQAVTLMPMSCAEPSKSVPYSGPLMRKV
jgi:hypothetical protein